MSIVFKTGCDSRTHSLNLIHQAASCNLEGENCYNIYDLGFESILKDAQGQWTFIFLEFILFRYTILQIVIRSAVNNNKP